MVVIYAEFDKGFRILHIGLSQEQGRPWADSCADIDTHIGYIETIVFEVLVLFIVEIASQSIYIGFKKTGSKGDCC